jgi:ferredoxin
MLIRVDTARCTGHARCHDAAPEVYELDDNGYCDIVAVTPPAADEPAARRGAASCPERAIHVEP